MTKEMRLGQKLTEQFAGRLVLDDLDYFFLQNTSLLEASVRGTRGRVKEYMELYVDTDRGDSAGKNRRISKVRVGFHTSSFGDSGLGEEDPDAYWTDDQCLRAAARFVKKLLAKED